MTMRILVRGSNDIGSAVAHALFRAGYAVVVHDNPQPTTTRRKMAFTDAIFDGSVVLVGVESRRVKELFLLLGQLMMHTFIPVVVTKLPVLLEALNPHILVDAQGG